LSGYFKTSKSNQGSEFMENTVYVPKEKVEDILKYGFQAMPERNLTKKTCERFGVRAGLSEEDRKVAREVMRQQSIDAGRNGRATELTGATVSDAKSTILKNINDQLQSNSIFEYSNRNKKYKNEEYVQNLIKRYGVLINNDILMAGPAAKTADVQDKITNKRLQQMINQFKKDSTIAE